MSTFEELIKMSDKELLKIITTEGGAGVGSPAGSMQLHLRDSAKAILDHRSSQSMIKLTKAIYVLTIVMVILTVINICLFFNR